MGRFKRVVSVDLRPALLDPEGEAILGVLASLGYGVEEVRVGRRIQLVVTADSDAEADRVCAEMASRVLANPVMETFRIAAPEPLDAR